MSKSFYEDLSIGRKSEIEVIELFERYRYNVEDKASDMLDYDIIVSKDNEPKRYVEVKNQKALLENKIVLELFVKYNPEDDHRGWFYKNDKVTDYCFHKDGTNVYFFIDSDALHFYVIMNRNKLSGKWTSEDKQITYININDLLDYCKDSDVGYAKLWIEK